MRAYVIATGVIFGLVTVAHVWRIVDEGAGLLRRPGWVALTAIAAGLGLWAFGLIWQARPGRGK